MNEMDDSDALDPERLADDLSVDGLLREALREEDDRDASLERALDRLRTDGRPAAPSSAWYWTFRTLAAAALLMALGILVTDRAPDRPVKIVSGSAVTEGNRVVTGEGQKAALQLVDLSVVRVAENTELVVRPNDQGVQVEMPQGEARFEVTKKQPGKSFQVATTHGDIVVHGTTFTASVDQGALVVRVEEGLVEVRNALGSARLYAGEHAVLTQDRPPDKKEKLFLEPINVKVPPIASDPSVKLDYDIVYVRARRAGDEVHKRFYTDFSQPVTMEPGADLMLLHPDGSEELLVEGGIGSITDPMVSFDGQWVYYSHLYSLKNRNQWSPPAEGADIFKIHLKSRKIVRLTNQVFDPNTGTIAEKHRYPYGVFNMGACPLPGGKIVFTSNREGFRPSKGYPAVALQLFVMDDRDESVASDDPRPANLHKIGHLNIAGALHPVVLADGRIMFSSLESQGIRSEISWGIWTINPDGTEWGPLISAFDPGGASNGFHFQTQLSDRSVIIEQYYNQNNSGFGAYIQLPASTVSDAAFGPGYMNDTRNVPWRFGRFDNGKGKRYKMPFMPSNSISFTPFSLNSEGEADKSVVGDKSSPRVGKFTHPSGAPDNHMLTIYSPGPVNHQYTFLPQLDGGIYLAKNGKPVQEPADLRLIKNDPNYNESWPRAVVPYERIYGIKEPKTIAPLANDGSRSPHLPEGTPFGLVGSSSLYKRESYPNGVVPEGSVTSTFAGGRDPWRGLDPFTSHGYGMPHNWHNQGGDAGLYSNDEIHALRILAMEPTTDRREGPKYGRRFYNHANERLRILGEIPVRKFEGGKQPVDPDGNPDTSFLARIPADTAFTFQTIDKSGFVLNNSQTWHQLRPGEIRTNCGGCHAHSQKPTMFEDTLASKRDYKVWDLLKEPTLVTSKAADQSGKKWDEKDETGVRTAKGPIASPEYFRDIQPILKRSCAACHTKSAEKPAGNLVLDADDERLAIDNQSGRFPGTYVRLALDERAKFGPKPGRFDSWGYPNASRYIRKLQARRSLLAWKIFGKRLDGFSNDDHPSETEPGSGAFFLRGQPVDSSKNRSWYDLDYLGQQMPPADAVAGTYVGPDGKKIKVEPLSDEDRRTIVRWIDLGCPLDLDYDPEAPEARGFGWMADDNRPVLTLTYPQPGANGSLSRIRLGMHDYYTGLDPASLRITADFAVDGAAAGQNLASKFVPVETGVWEMKLSKPVEALPSGRLTVEVKDRQGNTSRIVRLFSVK
jgi:hypothetical protein